MVNFNTVRLAVLGTVLLLSLIPLGIAAAMVGAASEFGITFPALSVAVAVINIVTIIACFVIDRMRRGAITSLVWAELVWAGLLSILWLAAAAHATTSLGIFLGDCSAFGFFDSAAMSQCHQVKALQAFSFLIWLILSAYWIALLTFAIRSQSHGNKGAFQTPTTELGIGSGKATGAPSTNQVYPQQTGATVYPQTTGGTAPYPQYGAPQPQFTAYPPQSTPTGYAPPTTAP